MPPPGSDFDALAGAAEQFGDIVDIGPTVPGPAGGPSPDRANDQQTVPDDGPPPGADEPPAHARQERKRRERDRSDRARPKAPPRVTAAIRGDIESKISFALEIPGRVWQARDPVCGTVFVEQRPEIAGALTEIVCQSPDLIAWFSGQGGQFMLWLNLAAACWPVATVALAHHVYHSIEAERPTDYQQPDYSRYAA
jgi:hypothetical protein